MKILISTDTSCLIDNEALKKYDISVFPLNVIVNGEEFLDGVTINQEELKVAMRGGKKIKTSTPPLGEVVEYFEKLLENPELEKYIDTQKIRSLLNEPVSSLSDLDANTRLHLFIAYVFAMYINKF